MVHEDHLVPMHRFYSMKFRHIHFLLIGLGLVVGLIPFRGRVQSLAVGAFQVV